MFRFGRATLQRYGICGFLCSLCACTPTRKPGVASETLGAAEIARNLVADARSFRSMGTTLSTIAKSTDEKRILVVTPEEKRLTLFDAESRSVLATEILQETPRGIMTFDAGFVLVLRESNSLLVIDAAGSRAVDVPCAAIGEAVIDTHTAFVSCPLERQLVEIDVATLTVSNPFPVGFDAVSLGRSSEGIVAIGAGGEIFTHDKRGAMPSAKSPIDLDAEERITRSGFVFDADAGALASPLMALPVVLSRRSHARGALVGGYASSAPGEETFSLRVRGRCNGNIAARAAGTRGGLSGGIGGHYDSISGIFYIVFQQSKVLATFHCPEDSSPPAAVKQAVSMVRLPFEWRVGAGASSPLFLASKNSLVVHNAFENSISLIELSNPADAAKTVALPSTSKVWTSNWNLGRMTFHDATQRALTPNGSVACASCHPGGGDDGQVWSLFTPLIAAKTRSTPALWAASRSPMRLHWDGAFKSLSALTSETFLTLMGGTGSGYEPAALDEFMLSLRPLLPPPSERARTGKMFANAKAGESLFTKGPKSCASCHTGEFGTDGLSYEVKGNAKEAAERAMTTVRTPGLVGVGLRSRFFHDGSTLGLVEALAVHADLVPGSVATPLTASERQAVRDFLFMRF